MLTVTAFVVFFVVIIDQVLGREGRVVPAVTQVRGASGIEDQQEVLKVLHYARQERINDADGLVAVAGHGQAEVHLDWRAWRQVFAGTAGDNSDVNGVAQVEGGLNAQGCRAHIRCRLVAAVDLGLFLEDVVLGPQDLEAPQNRRTLDLEVLGRQICDPKDAPMV